MQTQLATLRSKLASLRHRRFAVRWGSAFCATTAAMVWLLIAVFLGDWSLNLPIPIRWTLLPLWIAGSLFRRWKKLRSGRPLLTALRID